MDQRVIELILNATGATEASFSEEIQALWSGYGSIIRYSLVGTEYDSVVVKHVRLPRKVNHPRGWATDISHMRKLHSYEVETQWYRSQSNVHNSFSKVPRCIALKSVDDDVIMILEDLDASGYSVRKSSAEWSDVELCLDWLAGFHASHLGESTDGLWEVGSYWHLDTRPDELSVLSDTEPLKQCAHSIDATLTGARYKTLIHGDAKIANFCFSKDGSGVAAVDFQYIGGGCGMKDVAYFVGSCLDEGECEKRESTILDYYFDRLKEYIGQLKSEIEFSALESEWRSLYPFAWADFHRFLKGWSPGHWKINSYSERIAQNVVATLKK
ncbi:MAG: ecdysteroid 22-kinase family protein [Fibrobacterales bacterium]